MSGTVTEPTIKALRRALHHAEAYFSSMANQPVAATVDLDTLRARVGVAVPRQGVPPEQVIDELVAASAGGWLCCAGGRFHAWVIGGALPAALAADWLTSTWDQNAALLACSPAAAVIEEVAGRDLLEILDLPRHCSFAFTTGCQLAHFTALAAARHKVLGDVGWDVNEAGLCGAPRIRVVTSDHRHGSVERAVRYLGLGTQSLVSVPADAAGRIAPRALEDELRHQTSPTIVVLNAADLNIAACDSFDDLIPMAKSLGAWVHIDGAFGLFARTSRTHRHHVEGVEKADSWATDGHKWLNVPFDCGMVFVRDREAHRAAMTVNASYIAAEPHGRDQIDWNPEWSRRARGVAVYAALRELGREGLEELVDGSCAHAAALVAGIGALPTAEVLWSPHLNQGLVRFLDPRAGARAEDHDDRTDAVIAAVNAGGEVFFSGTRWQGRRAMRVSVVNWRTTEADVQRSIAAVAQALQETS